MLAPLPNSLPEGARGLERAEIHFWVSPSPFQGEGRGEGYSPEPHRFNSRLAFTPPKPNPFDSA